MSKLMKGHTFAKGKHKLKYPAIAEVKLDEIRCDIRRGSDGDVGFQSYADKALANLGSFAKRFDEFMVCHGVNRLDCGVLVNDSFNDTYRWTRSTKGVPVELASAIPKFILFDVPQDTRKFQDRLDTLDSIAHMGAEFGLDIIRPERVFVDSEEAVFAMYEYARNKGKEGLMVKALDHVYELDKRSYGWLKVKPEEDADGVITAINRAVSIEGVPLDRAGSIDVECEDGSAASIPGIEHELGRLMLAHPEQFIGQWCEFQYMERDRQGGYRHPRFHRLREAKA